jgi:hypothetical protein
MISKQYATTKQTQNTIISIPNQSTKIKGPLMVEVIDQTTPSYVESIQSQE